ncbi:MAG: hypothetical protein D3910_16385, partial [Candidatus Electrothrix sp. ATG2]|nr:hypothetical protein [Candidatus Electrothrix sp. ATG2]
MDNKQRRFSSCLCGKPTELRKALLLCLRIHQGTGPGFRALSLSDVYMKVPGNSLELPDQLSL